MRLNKYLARYAGVSRREADRLIEAGKVTVNGAVAELGTIIEEDEAMVCIGEQKVVRVEERHYYAVYKPVGYISSTVRQTPEDILVTDLIPHIEGMRLFPMGRLDKDSEGLIILTDDGELMDKVLRSRYGHEKEYRVRLNSPVTDAMIKEISAGGLLIDAGRPTRPCTVKRVSRDELTIVLTEGMNREIRRIFERYDIKVRALCRVRFMDITLDGLAAGESRPLTDKEVEGMKKQAGLS